LCRLGEASKGLLHQLGKLVPLRDSAPGRAFFTGEFTHTASCRSKPKRRRTRLPPRGLPLAEVRSPCSRPAKCLPISVLARTPTIAAAFRSSLGARQTVGSRSRFQAISNHCSVSARTPWMLTRSSGLAGNATCRAKTS
jgi:hypothetical protein